MRVQEVIDGHNTYGEHLIKRETSYRPVSLRLCTTTTLRWLIISDMFILRLNLNMSQECVDCIDISSSEDVKLMKWQCQSHQDK